MFETRLGETAADRSWSTELIDDIVAHTQELVESPSTAARSLALKHALGHVDEQLISRLHGITSAADPGEGDVFSFDETTPLPPAPRVPRPDTRKPLIVDDVSAVFDDLHDEPSEILVAGEIEQTLAGALAEINTVDIAPRMIALCATVGAAHHGGHAFGNLAPENIRLGDLGEVAVLDPSAPTDTAYSSGGTGPTEDVFALGCILFEAFASEPWSSPPPEHDLAPAIAQVIARATHDKPRARFRDGLELLRALQTALAPSETQNTAQMLSDAAQQAREEAGVLRQQAHAALDALPLSADESARRTSWRELVAADSRDADAAAFDQAALFELLAAAAARPDDPVVNHALADHLRQRHARLETQIPAAPVGEIRATADLIRRYDRSAQHHAYLEGKARFTLHTDRPATVDLYRYEARDRRLWPTPVGSLGATPIEGVKLPMGSYVAILHTEDGPDVRYPVLLHRSEHWTGGTDDPAPIRLPTSDEIDGNEIWIPAGPFRYGDPSEDGLSAGTRCEPGFAIERHPVSMERYLEFLRALRKRNGAELSERCLPQTPERSTGVWPRVIWAQERYHLIPDREGRTWLPDWPAACIPFQGAQRFASWFAERDGLRWSLPTESQWEKAARGADGRKLPWGDHAEVLYARFGAESPVTLDAFPADSSPYGVRGMAGNVADWVIATQRIPCGGVQVARGAHFASGAGGLSLTRRILAPDGGSPFIGFRMARPLD